MHYQNLLEQTLATTRINEFARRRARGIQTTGVFHRIVIKVLLELLHAGVRNLSHTSA
jgi:hypothetical protein